MSKLEELVGNNGPCCAHLRVKYDSIDNGNGTMSDRWTCFDCRHKFWPEGLESTPAERQGLTEEQVQVLVCKLSEHVVYVAGDISWKRTTQEVNALLAPSAPMPNTEPLPVYSREWLAGYNQGNKDGAENTLREIIARNEEAKIAAEPASTPTEGCSPGDYPCLQKGCPKCEGIRITKTNVAGYEKGFKAAQEYGSFDEGHDEMGFGPAELVPAVHEVDLVEELRPKFREIIERWLPAHDVKIRREALEEAAQMVECEWFTSLFNKSAVAKAIRALAAKVTPEGGSDVHR